MVSVPAFADENHLRYVATREQIAAFYAARDNAVRYWCTSNSVPTYPGLGIRPDIEPPTCSSCAREVENGWLPDGIVLCEHSAWADAMDEAGLPQHAVVVPLFEVLTTTAEMTVGASAQAEASRHEQADASGSGEASAQALVRGFPRAGVPSTPAPEHPEQENHDLGHAGPEGRGAVRDQEHRQRKHRTAGLGWPAYPFTPALRVVWRDECRARITSFLTSTGHRYLKERTAASGRVWFSSEADVAALTDYLVDQASSGSRAALWCSHDLGERGGGDSDGGGTHREHEYLQIEFEFLKQRAGQVARNLCLGASAPQRFVRRSDQLAFKKAARLQAMHEAAEARVRRTNPQFVKEPSKALRAALEAVEASPRPAVQDVVPSPQTGRYAPVHDPDHLRKYNQWRGERSAEKSRAAKEQRRLVLLELPPTGLSYVNAIAWLAENKNVTVSRDQMRRWWREFIAESVVPENDPRKPKHGGAR